MCFFAPLSQLVYSCQNLLFRHADNTTKQDFSYPLKILLLGNHSSGKSSLVNFLSNFTQTGSTHILRVKNYYIETSSIPVLPNAIFFDFGGQDFYHGLYRSFISSGSLHILLFDPQNDKNQLLFDTDGIQIANFSRRYWLGQKRYIEHRAQNNDDYIIIQSFADRPDDEESPPLDYKSYKGYLKNFWLSLQHNDGLSNSEVNVYQAGRYYFKAFLDNYILQSKMVSEPLWYIRFLTKIISKKKSTLYDHLATPVSELLEYYSGDDSTEKDKLENLKNTLTILHRHGLVLYYNSIEQLQEIVWLDPKALVDFIQKNILSKSLLLEGDGMKPGIIKKDKFEALVGDERILLLMKEQKVIFLHRPTDDIKRHEYIIPNYLNLFDKNNPSEQMLTFGLGTPNFHIMFTDFIPFGFINQMICFFGKEPEIKRFWRNQLLFTLNREVRILIALDFECLKIDVHIQALDIFQGSIETIQEYLFISMIGLYWGFGEDNRKLLNYEQFLAYKKNRENNYISDNASWNMLQGDKSYVPEDAYISIDNKLFINYMELFELDENESEINAYYLQNKQIEMGRRTLIPVHPFESFTSKKFKRMKKVFISYSHADSDIRTKLESHFKLLERSRLISTWHDMLIDAGSKWDEKIETELQNADIVILLISDSFFASDYIWNKELPIISKKINNSSGIIIPILCRHCLWNIQEPFSSYIQSSKDGEEIGFKISSIQGLPIKNNKLVPIHSDAFNYIDEAYAQIAEKLFKLLNKDDNLKPSTTEIPTAEEDFPTDP